MEHYYTVYLAETDEIVAFGSAAECAKQMGIAERKHLVLFATEKGICRISWL